LSIALYFVLFDSVDKAPEKVNDSPSSDADHGQDNDDYHAAAPGAPRLH